jgi:PPOX class probable F420-dependent enzyme
MERPEIEAFLQREPGILGHIATVRRDGRPQVVPVWFRWDGTDIVIWTTDERAWVQQVHRTGHAAFSAGEDRPPYAAVLARGPATVVTDGAGTDEEIRQITRRYLPEEHVEGYAAEWAALRTIVRIRPDVLRGWARGY